MDMLVRGNVVPNGYASSIEVTWANNNFNGGSVVLGYYLQHNSG